MISVLFLAIIGFIGFYIIVLFLVVIFNIITRFFVIKSYKKNNKEIISRHKNLDFDKFEVEVIKKVCSEKIFPFYFIYTSNYNIWKDLKEHLSFDEKVNEISSTFFKVSKGFHKQFFQAIFFSTTKGRFFLYQDTMIYRNKARARLLEKFDVSDIKALSYQVDTKHMKLLKYCVPARLFIDLKNGKNITVLMGCAITLEKMRERIFETLPLEQITISKEDMELDFTQRQVKKIEETFKSGKLKESEYKELLNRAQKSSQEIMKDYFKDFANFDEESINNKN